MMFAAAVIGLLGSLLVFDPHVRSEAPDRRALVREGVARSATLGRLVDRLQASDVVVYVECSCSITRISSGGRVRARSEKRQAEDNAIAKPCHVRAAKGSRSCNVLAIDGFIGRTTSRPFGEVRGRRRLDTP